MITEDFPTFPIGDTTGASGPCTPGQTRGCSLDLLCTGTQTCNADGDGFDACDCSGSVIASGDGVVGAECQASSDCLDGGTCFTADGNDYRGLGGPAGGYCTFVCSNNDECVERDPHSLCGPVGPGGSGVCVRTCQSRDPEPGEDKCLNRPNLVCLSMAANGESPFMGVRQEGVCVPRCASDSECPEGRVCSRQLGFCRDSGMQTTGAPAGARCTLATDCDGRECVDRNDEDVGTCTSLCTLGVLAGCGYAGDAEERGAACLAPLVSGGGFSEGVGDVGVCQQLCDVDADCSRVDEGGRCIQLGTAAATFFGRSGACVSPPDP